jgi:hypothetical protein
MNAVIGTGSTQDTVCDDEAHGYFIGDLDTLPEPLRYRESISGSSIALSSAPISPVASRPTG